MAVGSKRYNTLPEALAGIAGFAPGEGLFLSKSTPPPPTPEFGPQDIYSLEATGAGFAAAFIFAAIVAAGRYYMRNSRRVNERLAEDVDGAGGDQNNC